MSVDVRSDIDGAQPRIEVAAYTGGLDTTTEWYQNIKAVDWKTPRPLRVGSQIAFVARFLGRRLAYTYEVTELIPGRRVVMRMAEGPFPMETSHTLGDNPTWGYANDTTQDGDIRPRWQGGEAACLIVAVEPAG
jgi:hypothetical protein